MKAPFRDTALCCSYLLYGVHLAKTHRDALSFQYLLSLLQCRRISFHHRGWLVLCIAFRFSTLRVDSLHPARVHSAHVSSSQKELKIDQNAVATYTFISRLTRDLLLRSAFSSPHACSISSRLRLLFHKLPQFPR